MGVWKRRREENLTNDTPPKKCFWSPFVWYVFHPPRVSLLFFPCTRVEDWPDQTLFSRGPEIFWRVRCSVRSPPPLRFAPPHVMIQFRFFFSASEGSLHWDASLKVDKAHFAAWKKGSREPRKRSKIAPPLCAAPWSTLWRAFFSFFGGIAQLSCDTLQNGVSHRCACVKLSTKGGYRTTLGECEPPPPPPKSIARSGVSQR